MKKIVFAGRTGAASISGGVGEERTIRLVDFV